jgi:hypothetical protein
MGLNQLFLQEKKLFKQEHGQDVALCSLRNDPDQD